MTCIFYCNAILAGASKSTTDKLQLVLNAGACSDEQYQSTIVLQRELNAGTCVVGDMRKWTAHFISLFLPNQSQQSSFSVIGYAEAGRQKSQMTCHLL